MERTFSETAPDPAAFSQHFALVQSYVRSEPGARRALMSAATDDPVAVTTSIVALGAMLLDIAAEAFSLTPDQMLDKIASNVTGEPHTPV